MVHLLKTQIEQITDKIKSVKISLDTLCDTTKAIESLIKNKKEKYGKTKADNSVNVSTSGFVFFCTDAQNSQYPVNKTLEW